MQQSFEDEPAALLEKCSSLEEAKYLLEHVLNLAIDKGVYASQKETESKELSAKLHQENVNSTLQRDMLQYLIVHQTGIEIDAVDDNLIRGDTGARNLNDISLTIMLSYRFLFCMTLFKIRATSTL